MIGVSNPKTTKYLTKTEAANEYVPKTDFDPSVIDGILNSINTLNNEVIDINTDITNINSDITTINSNVSTNTTNIQNNSNDISNLSSEVNTNTTNISTNTTDITNLKSRVSTCETNISTNTTNISTNTTDITNLKSRISTCETNISTNTTNISNNTTDITNLKSRVSTCETNISTNTTNISNNTTEINNIKNNLYDGLYRCVYGNSSSRAGIEYNYGLGKIIYWWSNGDGMYITAINNNDENFHLNDNIETIVLPGTINQLNSDGSVRSVITQLYYGIDEITDNKRKELRYLTTITVLPDVYSINFNLNAAPAVMNLNLFEGLQELTLHGYETTGVDTTKNINLIIPASVKKCKLEEIRFGDLIFNGCDRGNTDDQQPIKLKLQCDNVCVENNFKCLRRLTSSGDSYWIFTNNSLPAPKIVEISTESFDALFYNTTVNFGSGQGGHTTLILHENWNSGTPFNMSFYRVINMTTISASNMATRFPNAIIVG